MWLEGQVMEWVEGAQTGKRANVFLLLSLPGAATFMRMNGNKLNSQRTRYSAST